MPRSDAWKEQPDGTWLQAYDGMEKYFFAISAPDGQPTPFMIGSRVPTVAAVVTDKGKLYRPADSEAVVQEWLSVSFRVHDGPPAEDNPESCFARFRQVPHIILHYFPRSRELLIQACHVLIDGIGALYLWDRFFSILATPSPSKRSAPGTESALLLPVTTELLGVPSTSSPAGADRANRLVGTWAGKTYSQDAAGIPVVHAGQPPGDSYLRREVRLPRPATDAVVRACKRNGYTVTCAWQAAVLLAMRRHANLHGVEEPACASATVTMNLRPHFSSSASFDPRSAFAAPYYFAMPFDVDYETSSSFDKLARHSSAYFHSALAPGSGDLEMIPAYLDLLVGATASESKPPPSSAPILSSLGVVDNYLRSRPGTWEIAGFWLADTTTTEMSLVFLWTFRGEMVLSMSPNARYMTTDMADHFLAEVRDIMVKELNI
ncbi:putative secondary metabolism biosynthetic enzyme [Pestalotiopsis sp. IQ-011]